VPMSDAAFARLTIAANDIAFRLAGISSLDMVEDVRRSLERAVSSGESFEDWKAKIKRRLLAAWSRDEATPANPGWRLETIFRTNVQRAYSAGRYVQLSDPVVMQARPYRLYDAIIDERTTETCQERNGVILPASDPWWESNWPPLHFNCRAGVRSLRESQARRRGMTTTPPDEEAPAGFGTVAESWEPDPSRYPPDLWAAYEARQRTE
jgi:SPP1 gp7 family putative phage head morphogenesis protein